MNSLRKLVIIAFVLATLLFIIDAGKKDAKKKEVETRNENEKNIKMKKTETSKEEKFNRHNGENNLGKSKMNTKKAKKHSANEEKIKPKITKTYQKVNKYKIVEDGPAKKFQNKPKKSRTQENFKDELYSETEKSQKKTSQKMNQKERFESLFQEDMTNNLQDDENILNDDETENNPKRKKYKLVEVVLEENEQEKNEENETLVEFAAEEELEDIQRTESEEVIEKFKTVQTVKLPKIKKVSKITSSYTEEKDVHGDYVFENEEEVLESNESDPSDYDENVVRGNSRYEDPDMRRQSCQPIPDDPNRQGPKKLTMYVVEEEIGGQIQKRVVAEEDGVTMCEVADLLKKQYLADLPET